MVRPEGLEPPAYWFEANNPHQISYLARASVCVTPALHPSINLAKYGQFAGCYGNRNGYNPSPNRGNLATESDSTKRRVGTKSGTKFREDGMHDSTNKLA